MVMKIEHKVIMVGEGEFPVHLPLAMILRKNNQIVCRTNDDVDTLIPASMPHASVTVLGSISSLCVARAVKKSLRAGVDRVTVPLNKLDGYEDKHMLKDNADKLAWGLHCQGVDIEDVRLRVKPTPVWIKAVEDLKHRPFFTPIPSKIQFKP